MEKENQDIDETDEKFELVTGQTADFSDRLPEEYMDVGVSEVVGIDHYRMDNFEGQHLEWTSYTLVSKNLPDDHPHKRWWAVEMPGLGPHFYFAANGSGIQPLSKEPIETRLSGCVNVNSEGDSSLSSQFGALATYKSDGILVAQEIFEGKKPIVMIGFPAREL